MDRRIKLAKKYFVPTAAPMKKHSHFCHVCHEKWPHVGTRCARRGHRDKICPSCTKKGESGNELPSL